jgi:hypothetical protein
MTIRGEGVGRFYGAEEDALAGASRNSDHATLDWGFNQRNLLFAPPIFEFLLAANGLHHGTVAFKVHKIRHVVFCSESAEGMRLVLADSRLNMAGNADVEHTALTTHHVNVIGLFHAGILCWSRG